jgi:hypothetical protein
MSNLAAWMDRENEHSSVAAKLLILTDQFFTLHERKIRDKLSKWFIRALSIRLNRDLIF